MAFSIRCNGCRSELALDEDRLVVSVAEMLVFIDAHETHAVYGVELTKSERATTADASRY